MATEAQLKVPTAVTDACYRPIYRSHSKLADKDEAGLIDILRAARTNNAALGVTGR